MRQKIGIMGGTFNPIHNGHIRMALCAAKQYHLKEIWFIPAGLPPHKKTSDNVSPRQRLEMAELAVAPYPEFSVIDYEVKKDSPSYSYETLEYLADAHPNTDFYFIMGEDSLATFLQWKNPDVICSYAHVLVAGRQEQFGEKPQAVESDTSISEDLVADSSEQTQLEGELQFCREVTGGRFSMITMTDMPVSSSAVRESVQNGEDISSMVPAAVSDYIKNHHLYQIRYDMQRVSELQKDMKKELHNGRYQHTLGVMYTAAALAMAHGYPLENAMVAGVLHDCAKCLSDEKKLRICEKEGIPVREVEKDHPHLLHGKVGAFLAKDKYHIKDVDILHAIEVHTTGCPGMNLLDEIIFVADYTEPGRNKAPHLEEVRRLAFCDLHGCVYKILKDTVEYLAVHPEETDMRTLETLEFYEKNYRKESI